MRNLRVSRVYLLFRLSSAFREKHLRRFNDRRVERGEAVEAVAAAQGVHEALHLRLVGGEQFHEPGQGPGLDAFHSILL